MFEAETPQGGSPAIPHHSKSYDIQPQQQQLQPTPLWRTVYGVQRTAYSLHSLHPRRINLYSRSVYRSIPLQLQRTGDECGPRSGSLDPPGWPLIGWGSWIQRHPGRIRSRPRIMNTSIPLQIRRTSDENDGPPSRTVPHGLEIPTSLADRCLDGVRGVTTRPGRITSYLQLQQTGDEADGPPGRYGSARRRDPTKPTGCR